MTAEFAVIVAASLGGWASVLAAVLHRTNGSGPLARKLDVISYRVDRLDRRVRKVEKKL